MKIQAIWRGRDIRHFLEHPASRVYNLRHPGRDSNICYHLRTCKGCFLQELYFHNLTREIFIGSPLSAAWLVRCLYLVAFDPARVTYDVVSDRDAPGAR